MSVHPFDAAIALQARGANTWEGSTSPAYANIIGPFGGISAAQALNAVLQHPQRLGEPVALTVNFAAALAEGPFEVVARPARTNRSTQHWVVEVQQAGQAVLTATAVTAVHRATWASSSETSMPEAPAPQDVAPPTGLGGAEWLNRYEMRFIEGGYPPAWDGREHASSRTRLWMRDQPARPLDFASLTGLCDVFLPRIWLRRATLVPIGTVTMSVYYHADAAQVAEAGSDYLFGQARAQAFHKGYFDQTAQLWSQAGKLLATTHQLVYYKE